MYCLKFEFNENKFIDIETWKGLIKNYNAYLLCGLTYPVHLS
jgi:hypothetical protein